MIYFRLHTFSLKISIFFFFYVLYCVYSTGKRVDRASNTLNRSLHRYYIRSLKRDYITRSICVPSCADIGWHKA